MQRQLTDKPANLPAGIAAILLSVFIYAVNFVATRYSVNNGLSAYDLVALRYLVAGIILIPYCLSSGLRGFGTNEWLKGLILLCMAGAPYMLVFTAGLSLAPASHGAVLNPGVVPMVVFISMVCLGLQSFSFLRLLSLLFIILGLIFVTAASFRTGGEILIGDLLMFITGISWGVFTLLIKLWGLRPMQVASIVSVLSLVYLPFYYLFYYDGFANASTLHIISQALFQGIIMSIGTLYLVAYAVQNLGAQLASLFSPAVPLITTILAFQILGESFSLTQWIGMFMVMLGMFFAAREKI